MASTTLGATLSPNSAGATTLTLKKEFCDINDLCEQFQKSFELLAEQHTGGSNPAATAVEILVDPPIRFAQEGRLGIVHRCQRVG